MLGDEPTLLGRILLAHQELSVEREEIAAVFDQSGNELFRTDPAAGSENEVTFEPHQFALLKDAIVIHNHLAGWNYPLGHPQHAGKSFSQEDVGMALEWDMLELRAVTPIWIYWMRRPAGAWATTATDAERRYQHHQREVLAEIIKLHNAGELTLEEGEGEVYHQTMMRISAELGFGYGRRRTT